MAGVEKCGLWADFSAGDISIRFLALVWQRGAAVVAQFFFFFAFLARIALAMVDLRQMTMGRRGGSQFQTLDWPSGVTFIAPFCIFRICGWMGVWEGCFWADCNVEEGLDAVFDPCFAVRGRFSRPVVLFSQIAKGF